jgi:hypothetical protein
MQAMRDYSKMGPKKTQDEVVTQVIKDDVGSLRSLQDADAQIKWVKNWV